MPQRKRLAVAALLLLVSVMPPSFGLGAHVFGHHEHEDEANGDGVEWSGLAKLLLHGHAHGEGVPDHEHDLLPSPPLRPEPPRHLPAPGGAFQDVPETERLPLASLAPRREGLRPSGSSPPLLQLLCVLLI